MNSQNTTLQPYDTLVVGPVSIDHNYDHTGAGRTELGGAVVASGFAAANSQVRTAVFCKLNPEEADVEARFEKAPLDLYWAPSTHTCSIKNEYFTPDKEKRRCTSLGVCDTFRFEEFAHIPTKLYHFAGLVYGDFEESLFIEASRHAPVAVDVQCLLRQVKPDHSMVFEDWAAKRETLPYIHYLKTDAAEAERLTGLTDRKEAARQLHAWGAKEVMITHNTEVLTYDGQSLLTCPIRARNLSGRTGRGDTTFAGYLAARTRWPMRQALNYATALVSLKMETPGPYQGGYEAVLAYQKAFYPDYPLTE